jgi:hypothetical protein
MLAFLGALFTRPNTFLIFHMSHNFPPHKHSVPFPAKFNPPTPALRATICLFRDPPTLSTRSAVSLFPPPGHGRLLFTCAS